MTRDCTLAGVAIKYDVDIADIRRANGLSMDDRAMFSRAELLVPRAPGVLKQIG